MKKVDSIIVGFGLAGLAYAETLLQADKSFHVIDANDGGSSLLDMVTKKRPFLSLTEQSAPWATFKR